MYIGDAVIINVFKRLEKGLTVTIPRSANLYESILNYTEDNYKIIQAEMSCERGRIRIVPTGLIIRK